MAAASSTKGSAAAEHVQPAAADHSGWMSDAGLDALVNFLALGLKYFWACSTSQDREWAIDAALVDLALVGKTYSLAEDAGAVLVKWWA